MSMGLGSSSWPALCRPSTPFSGRDKHVDVRDKPAHDDDHVRVEGTPTRKGLERSLWPFSPVIPAKAGIRERGAAGMDPGFRRGDGVLRDPGRVGRDAGVELAIDFAEPHGGA
jgi:hypothetical protein